MNTQAVAGEDKDGKEQILIRNSAVNQFVGNKNFINHSNTTPVWVDSEYSADARLPEVTIKFASEEYFKLIEGDRGLGQYLALGDQVVIVWKGNVYRIMK